MTTPEPLDTESETDINLYKDLKLKENDIAWLAGLLEGEGSFLLDSRASKRYEDSTAPPSPVLKISMTDQDVIEKVATMLQKKSFQAKEKTAGNKIEYIVSCQSRPVLFYLLPKILPYFGSRRAAQVKRLIDALEDYRVWYNQGGRSLQARKGYSKGIGKKKKSFNKI